MSSSNDPHPNGPVQQPPQGQPDAADQGPAGHSGEGAASALALLKQQTRQQRRQFGDGEDAFEASGP